MEEESVADEIPLTGDAVEEESVADEIPLTGDAMRVLFSCVEDKNDQAALTRLSKAWRHALCEQNKGYWRKEWEAFEEEYKENPWFTREVLDYEQRESRLSGLLNAGRELVGKDAKSHLSFRQRFFEDQTPLANPTYVDLLLANRQRQLKAMSEEKRKAFFQKVNATRPTLRQVLSNLAAIPGAVLLAGVGLALAPPGLVVQGAKIAIQGMPQRGGGGCGENVGVGLGQAFEDFWPLAPAALSLYGSFSLLTMFAKDAKNTLIHLRELYELTAKYMKKEETTPKNEKN
jgi:hypothetical protein